MADEKNLEDKVMGEAPSFLDKVLDASGAAIPMSMALKALVAGASGYSAALAYLVPYGAFKVIKHVKNLIVDPDRNLSAKGAVNFLSDTIANIMPTEQKVPAYVGATAFGTNYLMNL
ncbi:MAG: hypothetical protein KKC75_06540 [Nanoarchaeota archaeon]|nr:hypothetical protein [Nanoarchaeota archaeon]MBU1005933.1 hypothetical protein [Nanoarchaeota archaeon]MBU1946342.1 hypothetical protein [Nanoarchaeota archaeon]